MEWKLIASVLGGLFVLIFTYVLIDFKGNTELKFAKLEREKANEKHIEYRLNELAAKVDRISK